MKILVSGGGTGGHIYPALAFIQEVKKHHQDVEILYIGTDNGLEKKIVSKEGIPFQAIRLSGFKRKLSFENVKTVIRFLKGVQKSKQIIKTFQPDVALGTGGYVCAPVVYAASKMKIPTIIHEQNSVPGLTNKFLSKYVDKVAICFEEASAFFPKEKVVFTGNPRATEVANIETANIYEQFDLDKNKPTVLVVGGSRGARPINEAALELIKEMKDKQYQLLYVTGEAHFESVSKQLNDIGRPKNVKVTPFITNMPSVLKAVDVIVSRAGATTLAEITAIGLPSILIPSPYVTNNHQEKNARALEKQGAAIVRLEKDVSGEQLKNDIEQLLLDKKAFERMRTASLTLGMKDAAYKLYQLALEISSPPKT